MKPIRGAAHAAAASLVAVLAACSGGGSTPTASAQGPKPSAYPFVPPSTGGTDRFATTYVDAQGNTYVEQMQIVTSVAPDSSYTVAVSDPTHTVGSVGGITYRVLDEIDYYTAKGALQDWVITNADGTQTTCSQVSSYAFTGQGSTGGYNLGETWNGSYTTTCDGTSTTYMTNGEVQAIENVALAAGTIRALRIKSVTSWTTSSGQAITRTTLTWRDPAHSLDTVKFVMTFARSGNVPANYVTTETRELQARF
jgi:hypothetical protein